MPGLEAPGADGYLGEMLPLLLVGAALAAALPMLSGQTLAGQDRVLPRDLGAERAVVLIAFQRDHQEALDGCYPAARAAADAAGLPTWELMLLPQGLPDFLQGLIRRGMGRATPDPARQARKLLVGTDVEAARTALGITADQVHVALVETTGQVAWLRPAPCDAELAAALQTALLPGASP